MIVSVSRRCDIPAFAGDWFMEQWRRGEVTVRNPFRPARARTVSLKKEDVDAFVFWSRDPRPFLPHLAAIDRAGIPYYFLITVTGYPAQLEPGVPAVEDAAGFFRELAGRIGRRRVIWRYDPVLFSGQTPFDFHVENFSRLAGPAGPVHFPGDRQFLRPVSPRSCAGCKRRGSTLEAAAGTPEQQAGPAGAFCRHRRRLGAGNPELRRSGDARRE